jgi:hypothetical protein
MPDLNRRLSPAAIGLALAGLLAVPATAAPAQVADLTYDVYVGGLHIYSFDVEMTLLADRYRMTAKGETRGMVGMVYTWNMNLAAEGVDSEGRMAPQRYQAESQWQSRQRRVDLGFTPDGRYDLRQDPPPEPDPDIEGGLPESLPKNTVDPLTFAVAATRALQETGRCDQTIPVFDGQRRFDATVRHIGEATLEPNDYSVYQGPAVRCSLSINRISGFRKSVRAKQPRSTEPPTLWAATIREGLPPVPVRYEGEIPLGKIVIHLSGAEFRTEAASLTE